MVSWLRFESELLVELATEPLVAFRLGSGFYKHLQDLDDLIVFADEHHVYYGKAFSAAILDLNPYALIDLTATPHKDSEKAGRVIYRYPLAAAIADKIVKTPVVVGRKDDRKDIATKLNDGITLLEAKRQAVESYVETAKKNGKSVETINPVMLVIAPTIEHAEEIAELLRRSVAGGKYADSVLEVHSKATGEKREKMLAALDAVEEPTSAVRIIVSFGMLKEGWDVKNVYVIASLRSSISDVLTEQTLGHGMRLPFGAYTEIEMLDTLEVLAHERYEALLKNRRAESGLHQQPYAACGGIGTVNSSLRQRRRKWRPRFTSATMAW